MARQPASDSPGFGLLLGAIGVLLIATLGAGTVAGLRHAATVELLLARDEWRDAARAVSRTAADAIDEQPAFATVPGAPELPLCEETTAADARRLADAMNLMRRTDEGQRLFAQLLDEGICVGVEEIAYNSGYAYATQSGLTGSWSGSFIRVDEDLLAAGEVDVVAALLVHEATHIDRYVNGLACDYDQSCTELPNGVELEEEVAAHAAEAEWWIAAYGDDGKRFAIGYDYGLNRLVDAYLRGPAAFAEHVRSLRDDPREGDDW